MNGLKDKFQISLVDDSVILTREVFINELAKPATRFLNEHEIYDIHDGKAQKMLLVQLSPKHAIEMLQFTPGEFTEAIASVDSFICLGLRCVKRKDGMTQSAIIIDLHDTD